MDFFLQSLWESSRKCVGIFPAAGKKKVYKVEISVTVFVFLFKKELHQGQSPGLPVVYMYTGCRIICIYKIYMKYNL